MSKLEKTLQKIKQNKTIGLMTHVVVGYPTLDDSAKIVKTMSKNGADIIELQIPFSDPLADGPTIMKACEKALENGIKVADSFSLMKKLVSEIDTPLVFMSYYNLIFKYGVERFCHDAAKAGAAGLIVPDMPIDEESQEHFLKYAKKYNLHAIQVVSPVSTDERLKKLASSAKGFVYCTARQGTTGAKSSLDSGMSDYLNKVKKYFNIPLAVGFGISKQEHIRSLIGRADVAVIGSAIIEVINKNTANIERVVSKFMKDLQVE